MPRKADEKKRQITQRKCYRAVKKWHFVLWRAQKTFKVLENHVSGKYDMETQMGRKPALPEVVENKIVVTLKHASKQGIGISRAQLLRRTGEFHKRLRVTPFKHMQPSKDWWTGLKKNLHSELTIRRAEKLGSAIARMMNQVVVDKYSQI